MTLKSGKYNVTTSLLEHVVTSLK